MKHVDHFLFAIFQKVYYMYWQPGGTAKKHASSNSDLFSWPCFGWQNGFQHIKRV